MMKRIAVIGSTGSIGVQTLQVARERGYEIAALAAGSNIDLLEQQLLEHRPRLAAVYDGAQAERLRARLAGKLDIPVLSGREGVCACAREDSADLTLNAAVGIAGLAPTVAAIQAHKTLALANKESLVCAGTLVNQLARENGVAIVPVDSEHSAVFQCLQGSRPEEVERILLTASGGPFFGKTAEEMEHMTPAQALKHPSWSMGAKITIDSATMMNKGLELIEAHWLFAVPPESIDIVVHRESIVHSLIEYDDNAMLAQLGQPDMRIPIQYALTYPARYPSPVAPLDLAAIGRFTFFAPDHETFPGMNLCRKAIAQGGVAPAAVNAANEQAVALFLEGAIGFLDISRLVGDTLACTWSAETSLAAIEAADREARARVRAAVKGAN